MASYTIEYSFDISNLDVENTTYTVESLGGGTGEKGIQGEQGIQGIQGDDGQGVPIGGTANQVLSKIDATDFNTEWQDASGGKFVDGTDPLDAVYMDGNVGIGTETPSVTLDIRGDANPTFRLLDNQGGNVQIQAFNSSATIQNSYSLGTLLIAAEKGLKLSGRGIVNPDIVIDDLGNIGIGTETPSEKLEVDGNAKADSFLIDGGKAIKTDVVGEPTGSDQVVNVVSLTQAEYDASTPIATTFYIITE